jgi:aldose 1-epimerase
MKDAKTVWLKNKNLQVAVIPLGGRITSLLVPDRNGNFADVVLGYATPKEYLLGNPYYGTIIGRVANRIKRGILNLDRKTYSLAINNPPNHLHGGPEGFHNQYWNIEKVNDAQLILSHISKSGTENYPGNISVHATYTLVDQDFIIEYTATTDEPTVLNLTHHSFFNLAGEGNSTVLNHLVQLNADAFTPVDETQIPTGEIRSVKSSPFDFRNEKTIGLHINANDEQLRFGSGYDHNWVLNKKENDTSALSFAAKVVEPISGRTMEVWTTAPGMQFYTGNFLDGTDTGKSGRAYPKHSSFCLEPQHFPDAMNHSNFPPITLSPDERYYQKSILRFGVLS